MQENQNTQQVKPSRVQAFFNQPYQFSFKDFLAISMIAPFLFAVFRYMFLHIDGDLELIKTLVTVVVVVLGGYFSQEVASAYFTRGQTQTYNPYAYNPYGSVNNPVTNTGTDTYEECQEDGTGSA